MSTFSIGEADNEDDFAELRETRTPQAVGKDGKIFKLGAVPLKPSEPAKGEPTVCKRSPGTPGASLPLPWY